MKFDKNDSTKFRKTKNLKKRSGIVAKTIVGTIIICTSIFINSTNIEEITYTPNKSINNTENSAVIDSTPTDIPKEITPLEPVKETVAPVITIEPTTTPEQPVETIEPTTAPQHPEENTRNIDEDKQYKKTIALSFDDGPAKTLTPELLQILKDNDATATFFVLGNRVKLYSNIITEVYKSGNEIGNHSYNHADFTKLTEDQIIDQIKKTDEAIYEITNEYPILFRPPYGAINSTVRENVDSPIILWSIDSNDWRSISDEEVIANVMNNLGDGQIILMHDIHQRTIELTKTLIPLIREQGYDIVSISKLYELNNVELVDGYVYSKIKKTKY